MKASPPYQHNFGPTLSTYSPRWVLLPWNQQNTIGSFEAIYRRLHAPIENIEQLTEMEEYMANTTSM